METEVLKFGLELPPKRFNARAMAHNATRGVGTLTGLKTFSREELFAKIEGLLGAFPERVDKNRIDFWRAAISNSSLDTYFTRMARNSLSNYASDSESPSVSFQNSHKHDELGVGRSCAGQLIETGTPPEGLTADQYFPVVVTDFYSHLDLQLGEVSVEQFLLGIDTGIVRDVSIGFKEGEGFQYTCNICRQNYWSWDCRHIAGVEYEVSGDGADFQSDPSNSEAAKVLCFAWVENARLSEVSAVFDGACSNAMIIKAEREIRAGRLARETEIYLERRFRFSRSKDDKLWQIPAEINREEKPKTDETENNGDETRNLQDEENTEMSEKALKMMRTAAKNLGVEISDDESDERVVEKIEARALGLSEKAKAYDSIRETAIEDALKQKARAEGETFTDARKATVRKMLETAPDIETINAFGSEWRSIGDVKFPKERTSKEEADEKPSETALSSEASEVINNLPLI